MTDSPPAQKKKKSETRKKVEFVGVRLTPNEMALCKARAEEAGLTVASYFRDIVLGDEAETQGRKVPSLDQTLISQLLGQIGKVGSNLNQIAKRLNEGGSVAAERVTAEISEVARLREDIFKAIRCLDYDNQRKVTSGSSTGGRVSS